VWGDATGSRSDSDSYDKHSTTSTPHLRYHVAHHGRARRTDHLQGSCSVLLDPAAHHRRHGECPRTSRTLHTHAADSSPQILTGILRHYLTTLLQTAPKPQAINVVRQQRSLMRGVNLRNNYQQLSPSAFAARKAYMIQAYKDGTFLAEPDMRGQPKGNPMADPAAMEGMMGMMKGQVAMMVPQSLIMGWINAFFSGYVIMKLPFPLTPQFKSMLQSGVGTRDLDVRWVSSLSWYFLTLFGLQPVYNFILGSNNGTFSAFSYNLLA
jgi:hypothetical protein